MIPVCVLLLLYVGVLFYYIFWMSDIFLIWSSYIFIVLWCVFVLLLDSSGYAFDVILVLMRCIREGIFYHIWYNSCRSAFWGIVWVCTFVVICYFWKLNFLIFVVGSCMCFILVHIINTVIHIILIWIFYFVFFFKYGICVIF